MTFLNPLDALIPKIPFSFFPDFWVWVTAEAQGSVSVGFWGSCQLSPFGGGSGRRALSTPPPPGNENPASVLRWEDSFRGLQVWCPFLQFDCKQR